MTTLLLFSVFFTLFALRVPVTTAMGIGCIVALVHGGYPLSQIPRYMVSGIESFVLLAVPFFILVGNLLNASGATERIFAFSRAVFGWIPGAIAQVNIGASLIFAGMSGSALADAAGLGLIEIKAMRDAGYRPAFAAAITLASSVIGPIIPPSIIMVVYSAATGVSTGRMFLAGIVPGLLTGLMLMVYVLVVTKLKLEPGPEPEPFRVREVVRTGRSAFLPLLAPAIILGGMVFGIFTPTEAGVIAALYALVLGFVFRTFTAATVFKVMQDTAASSASILYLIAVSAVMGWIVTVEGTARDLVALLADPSSNAVVGLILINLVLLAVGCVIETTAAILICSTLLLPVAKAMGVDPVHFGVILCFNLLLGMMTPPMGVGLYVIAGVGRVPFGEVLRATIPFFIPLLAVLGIITFVPELSLWLPRLVFGSCRETTGLGIQRTPRPSRDRRVPTCRGPEAGRPDRPARCSWLPGRGRA